MGVGGGGGGGKAGRTNSQDINQPDEELKGEVPIHFSFSFFFLLSSGKTNRESPLSPVKENTSVAEAFVAL